MSLQLAAQHMASRGRGPDTMLVHMAPSEVNALQTVAKAHGGSLTVNPDTGLPEAGFLSSILPMVAGVGLTALSGGTLSPVMAGLLTGGGTALATGNLQKGLMAGLGAYGGAGLGAGLAGAGGNALAQQTQEALLKANPGLDAIDIAQNGAGYTAPQVSMTDKMLAGVKGLGSEAGRDEFMKQMGGAKGLFKSGYSAALPMMLSQSGQGARPPSAGGGSNPYEYDFTPGYKGPYTDVNGGTRYFDPRYVLRKADGGETYADGGDTGMTGQSDAYYRYLMGLSPSSSYTVAAPTAPAASAASKAAPKTSDAYYSYLMGASPYPSYLDPSDPALMSKAPEANFVAGYKPTSYEQSLARLTPAELATHYAYLTADRTGPGVNIGDQLPNPDNMFTENGQLNPIAAGLVSLGQSIPALANPSLGIVGAAISNAMQGQNMLDLNNSLNQALGGQGSGIPQPGQAGFAAALPGAIISQSSLASSQANDEMNASLNAAIANSAAQTAAASSQINDEVNASLNANATANAVGADNDDAAIGASVNDGTNGNDPGDLARGGLSSLAAFANGGYNLGDYSDGGRLLRGPGDGVSDSIPASIADKRPARLADGEFVVPARIVSELGNGSTEAGARKLYAMMDRVQQGRAKTTGKGRVAVNSRSDKYLPA